MAQRIISLIFFSCFRVCFCVIPQSEYLSLYSIYNSTNGLNWKWKNEIIFGQSWKFSDGSDPCYGSGSKPWQGIICDKSSIRCQMSPCSIQYLSLSSMSLTGSLPSEIGSLQSLKYLSISNNKQLTNSIPNEIGSLTLLEDLELSSNGLLSSIPSSICSLTTLTSLIFVNNYLTNSIPDCIGNLLLLQYLKLDLHSIAGILPSTIITLTNLFELTISNNQLQGPIPSQIGNLLLLSNLNICYNKFSFHISTSIYLLTDLVYLYGDGNMICY